MLRPNQASVAKNRNDLFELPPIHRRNVTAPSLVVVGGKECLRDVKRIKGESNNKDDSDDDDDGEDGEVL